MGTEYIIFQDGITELSLNEMSCKFDLSCDRMDMAGEVTNIFADLTPEDLVHIGAKILQTASYFMGDKDFPEALAKKLDELNMVWRQR